ncbi:regulator of protease activity HflC (stomatin/prohibitin superfamily) [Spinactinospora alkalitolerans]|uniref:Regulator of protease activity HflC (Stomatin/prohibitin superfamily) n=1 Tax=Spinactinospora alkalitolerans TaxID=687207 RepID=A0A852TS50_9ACTN|nr:SPFH domain-containing protein [Spinactinospora alkalitolerans]NYE46421.1 regulator of protease activity HflC (stomatin/prohibitin superfamily) [Spinactinospora alkalitolerans]
MTEPASHGRGSSSIKESLAGWSDIARLLRGGDQGALVPVVIPRDSRGLKWMTLIWISLYLLCYAVIVLLVQPFALTWTAIPAFVVAIIALLLAVLWWWRSSIVEIEQGTSGVLTKFGAVVGVLDPGRHYLWHPWSRVDFVVDTSTEIPYTAPVLACPTNENVPLKSIEFFLKFRIIDAVAFVRTIGASNFDLVLSNAVQDAIRQRSRRVRTEGAYDLRGSDVADMQDLLNRQLSRYGVRIMGCNIPDVQLPNQYQQHLATRERVAKELVAYEQEWELTRKRRIDTLLMDIERSKKTRDAKIVEVNAALNKARKDVAQMLEEQETEAQRVRYEIETRGRADLVAAQNEAKAQRRLATSYRDNRAVLQYELARRRLDVGATLAEHAPQPVVVRTEGGAGDSSALSTLLMAQFLPGLGEQRRSRSALARSDGRESEAEAAASDVFQQAQGAMAAAAQRQQQMQDQYQQEQQQAMQEQFQQGEGYGRQRRR